MWQPTWANSPKRRCTKSSAQAKQASSWWSPKACHNQCHTSVCMWSMAFGSWMVQHISFAFPSKAILDPGFAICATRFCCQDRKRRRRGHGDNGSQLLHKSQPIGLGHRRRNFGIVQNDSQKNNWSCQQESHTAAMLFWPTPSLQGHFPPTSVLFHDWMYALLCNGVMSIAIYEVLQEVNLWSNLAGRLACWNIPGQWNTLNAVSLFQAKRLEKRLKAQKLSSTASELLTALTLVDSVTCFQAIFHLVTLLQATWTKQISHQDIQHCVEKILALWKKCGWHMVKKHHWLLHIADNYHKHGIMPNCFTMERKNKSVGKIATAVQNTTYFESSILEEIVSTELAMVQQGDAFDQSCGLVKPRQAPKNLLHIAQAIWPRLQDCHSLFTSHNAKIHHGAICSKGDVVLVTTTTGHDAGQVVCFLSYNSQSVCIMNCMCLAQRLPMHSLWQETANQEAVSLEAIQAPVFWTKTKEGITTLAPA